MIKNILGITVLVILAGCSNKSKHAIGIVETLPDEYQVKKSKPLEVPPHYELEDI